MQAERCDWPISTHGRCSSRARLPIASRRSRSTARSGSGHRSTKLFEHWDQLCEWASTIDLDSAATATVDIARLGPPSPNPRQVFAIGLNYAAHAAESGHATPDHPTTFTKFPTCISGPFTTVELPSDSVDYEIELVVVIARHTHRVAAGSAWSHVAGLMVGQDLSERVRPGDALESTIEQIGTIITTFR